MFQVGLVITRKSPVKVAASMLRECLRSSMVVMIPEQRHEGLDQSTARLKSTVSEAGNESKSMLCGLLTNVEAELLHALE